MDIKSRFKALFKKKEKKKPQTPKEIVISWVKTLVGALIFVMIINGLLVASFVVPSGSMENTVMTGDFLFVNKFIYGPTTPQLIPFLNIPLPFYKFPGIKDPEKGDVIVFIYPGHRDDVEPRDFLYYLKRCVATAGDTIQIVNKNLYVNGIRYNLPPNGVFKIPAPPDPSEKYRTFPFGYGFDRDNYGPIRIPKEGDKLFINASNIQAWKVFIEREGHKVTTIQDKVMVDGKQTNYYKVERNYCFGMGDNRDHSEDSRYWGFIPYDNVVGTPMIVYWSWDTNMPMSNFGDKLSSIRFSRMGTIIR